MFIAALFTIAGTWKQPRCPSTDEWIRKLWYIHTKEYYSAIKRNAFESVLMRWMNLEPILQSEVSQREINTVFKHIHMGSRKMLLKNLGGEEYRRWVTEDLALIYIIECSTYVFL